MDRASGATGSGGVPAGVAVALAGDTEAQHSDRWQPRAFKTELCRAGAAGGGRGRAEAGPGLVCWSEVPALPAPTLRVWGREGGPYPLGTGQRDPALDAGLRNLQVGAGTGVA